MIKLSLSQKIILITGASSGIGAAAAVAFSSAGAKVAIAARRKEKLNEVAGKMRNALVLEVDMSEENAAIEMVNDVVKKFGRIDVLVNNAASIIISPSETVATGDLLKAFRTNLIGAVAATREAVLHMRSQGGGHIINIGSPGFMMGIPFYAPYVCSKAAFSAWTRTIQAEWAGSEIVVSEYFPGYISTESRAESRLGAVEQDFLMNPDPNFIARLFTKPGTPEGVARQLVKLILKPKTLVYSDINVKIGAFLSNIPGFRLAISRQMAETARRKKNLPIFGEKLKL
ncbi:MAG: SDR family NAD(P)-dependent oxidoreductase [Bacteroidetes bacterium]|nr:SDR family NAD(P)-dependent oxidoreductase [Bacteroidota bacterium]